MELWRDEKFGAILPEIGQRQRTSILGGRAWIRKNVAVRGLNWLRSLLTYLRWLGRKEGETEELLL